MIANISSISIKQFYRSKPSKKAVNVLSVCIGFMIKKYKKVELLALLFN